MNHPKPRRPHLVSPRDDDEPTIRPPSRTTLATRALRNSAMERRSGHATEADSLENTAADFMQPRGVPIVASGEVAGLPGQLRLPSEIADTLSNPDQAAIEASVARTDLLLTPDADIVALGVDAATSAKAANSFEKMLAHQIAALHTLTMKATTRALQFEKRMESAPDSDSQLEVVEFARMAQVASRLSSAFQDGLLTMQRLRHGPSQTMTIRHVSVETGAQAVIGNLKGPAGAQD